MKLSRVFLFIFILPVTIVLDFILFSLVKACPSCESFWAWVGTEGALSFPIVVGLTEWLEGLLTGMSTKSKV